MKTPRDILLAQHRAAENKLDALRREVIQELNNQETKEQSFPVTQTFLVTWLLRCSKTIWHELVFPSRRIWAGLATAWLLIFAINFSLRDHLAANVSKISSPEAMMTFQQQQRLLAELDNFNGFYVTEPKKFSPRPRSERIEISAT